jgi:hypothetical protein
MLKPASAAAAILGFCATLFIPRTATPQQLSAPETRTTWFVKNWTRAERWSFFEPPLGGGDPDYGDLGNRLRFGVERTARRYEFLAALQYVQFAGLPTDASGPGPLGVGAVYFDHSGRTDSRQLYVKYLRLRVKDLAPGLSLDIGRMGFADGAETSTGNATIDKLKLMRATGRLVGEFEWSLYERSFDGAQVDWDRGQWHIRAAALRPTQGGFEEAAGRRIDDIGLLTASASLRPNPILKSTDVQMFFYRYDDERPVRQRPDNTGQTTARADVHISSFGATLVGAYPSSAGSVDTLVWVAEQVGSWYDQSHRGLALGLEAGHQWRAARWQPWIRAGWLRASGDSDPRDGKHETLFQTASHRTQVVAVGHLQPHEPL